MTPTTRQLTKKEKLIKQVKKERATRIKRRLAKEKRMLIAEAERRFASFVKRLDRELEAVRKEVNNLPLAVYDMAFKINEGNRQDEPAVKIRYVFRSIEVTPDMNWAGDIITLRAKIEAFKWQNILNKQDKSNNYEHRTSPKQEQKKRHIGPGRSIAGSPPMAVQQL